MMQTYFSYTHLGTQQYFLGEKHMKRITSLLLTLSLVFCVLLALPLMQSLSNMTTGTGPLLGHDVKGKYASAKASFVASSGKVVIGGMTHPHMQPTYYLIARNNFSSLG